MPKLIYWICGNNTGNNGHCPEKAYSKDLPSNWIEITFRRRITDPNDLRDKEKTGEPYADIAFTECFCSEECVLSFLQRELKGFILQGTKEALEELETMEREE